MARGRPRSELRTGARGPARPTASGPRPVHRRSFVAGLAGTAMTAATADAQPAAPQPAAGARALYELRTYELRNDLAPGRAREFFEQQLVPAFRRAGVAQVASFTPESGLPTPSLVLLVPYASMADMAAVAARLDADAQLRAARDAWERAGGPPYVRYDAALYRAFAGHPRLEVPPAPAAGAAPHLFELRTYEAPNEGGLRNKVAMFNDEEIRIFRATGLAPVFFGEAVAGPRMPNLTYMLAFDDEAAMKKGWDAFRADAQWDKLKNDPAYKDTVSNITNLVLRPAAGSQV